MRIPLLTRLLYRAGALLGLLVLLAACAGGGTGQATPTPGTTARGTATGVGQVASPPPGIGLGPQACPVAIKNPAYWETLIPTQPGVSKVETVTCGYLKGVPTPQAMVTVRYSASGSLLDVYVYDNLAATPPVKIFQLPNLLVGDARISGYNTVVTAEVDPASSKNKQQTGAALTPDLFREFKWSDGAGTLVQVAFPGIFPDLTRYQAETDQAQVNQGQQPWKLSATMTAQALGASLLHWNADAPATPISGGGSHDTQAVVSLKSPSPGDTSITLTMARLEGNANGGIWVVTSVTATGLTITQPQTGALLHSTTTVTGTGSAFEGVIGKVTILDHLYTDIGSATVHGAIGNGNTTFSTSVTAQPTFKNGAQEGLVMLTATSNANGGVAAATFVKVLIQI